jgi:DNA-binding protein HU-beta
MNMAAQAKPITKAQLVTELAEKLGTTKNDVNNFMDSLTTIAYRETKKKGSFTLPGMGKLVLVKRKARMGRNPATGETIKIKAKTVVKFRVAKACKDTIIPPK